MTGSPPPKRRSPWVWAAAGCAALLACGCLAFAGLFFVAGRLPDLGGQAGGAGNWLATVEAAGAPAEDLPTAGPSDAPPASPVRPGPSTTAGATPALAPTRAATSAPAIRPSAPAAATQARPAPTAAPGGPRGDTPLQLRVLRECVRNIRDRYVYPNFNGLDLVAEQVAIAARIAAGMSDEDFYAEMRGLVERLNDHHSVYLSPAEVQAEDERAAGTGRYVGVGLELGIGSDQTYAYVMQAVPGGPAARAGIQAHEHILRVDGKPVIKDGDLDTDVFTGGAGSVARLTVRIPGGATREVSVVRAELPDESAVEARMLPGSRKIGYLYIPTFSERSVIYRTRDALRELMGKSGGQLDGLVIDLRNNDGGFLPVLEDHLGLFMSGKAGDMVAPSGAAAPIRASGPGVGNSQSVPLVLLTSVNTASFGEVFAGVLQYQRRARVIGQPTAGIIEVLSPNPLEDGSELLLAEEVFKLPDGSNWAHRGLAPNLAMPQTWDQVTLEADPLITAAVQMLGTP